MPRFNRNNIGYQKIPSGITAALIILLIISNNSAWANTSSTKAEANSDLKTIVVTLKPIYSLVAHLTRGISTPVLLSSNIQSAHHHHLLPSERRLLDKADMIIWIGSPMETYLEKIIQQNTRLNLAVIQTEGLNLLNKRSKHSDEHKNHARLSPNKIDPHIWLSTTNVKKISRRIGEELISHDVKNAEQYKKNLNDLLKKIEKTDTEIRLLLHGDNQPYIVDHDALQYFEKEYDLNFIASINSGEDTSVSAKQLSRINSLIKKHNIYCIFHQPMKPNIVDTITRNKDIQAIELDPLGISLNNIENDDSWFLIMKNLANNFHQCLNQ